MKAIPTTIVALFVILFISGCMERIDLDIIAENRIVIEAQVVAGESASVRITESISKTQPSNFPIIADAEVQLSSSDGSSALLLYAADGFYHATDVVGALGEHYELEVKRNGTSYIAQSQMPLEAVIIDSLEHQTILDLELNRNVSNIRVLLDRLPADGSYFIAKLIRNGIPNDQYFFYQQAQQEENKPFFTLPLDHQLSSGLEISVELWQVNQIIYDYFLSLNNRENDELVEGVSVAPPENPKGNFNSDALGYFSAMTVEKASIIVE